MAIKKVPNPEYKETNKAVASARTNVAKATAQHTARQSALFNLCKEREKAEQALNRIIDKIEDAFSARSDSETLLDETRETLTELTTILKETPKYIQGDN